MCNSLPSVNTAARMESNGQGGRIHVSATTARLLMAAGKQHWLIKREDSVQAKGKGYMETYWVNASSECAMTTFTSTETSPTSLLAEEEENYINEKGVLRERLNL